jgi:hypothetical protein
MRLLRTRLVWLICGGVLFSYASWALSIEGRVVNSVTNDPVPNAELTLACIKSAKKDLSGYERACRDKSAKATEEGTFSFDYLLPVKYLLTAGGVSGLVSTRLSQREIKIEFRKDKAEILLKLEPESIISGRVLNEEGQPKADVPVVALRRVPSGATSVLSAVAKAVSDKAGVYEFRRLGPGDYYVATAVMKPNPLIPKTINGQALDAFIIYAPGAISLEEAVATHLAVGQTASGFDLHLRSLIIYRIQGRAQMETAGQVVSGNLELHLDERNDSGVTTPGKEILMDSDGRFEANVLPGAYTLRLIGTTTIDTPPHSKTPPVPMVHLLAKQDIEISGKDQYGILLLIPPPFTITGRIHLEGTPEDKLEKGDVSLRPLDLVGASACQSTENPVDGSFSMTNCDPASYAVRYSPPAGTYVKSISFNEQDAMTHLIDLSRCSGGELKIVVRPGAASVSATVQDTSQQLLDVVLIPDGWTENELVPVIHTEAKEGKYTAAGLTPGSYTAIATAGVAREYWQNARFVHEMQERGVGFQLAENEQKSLVTPLLSEDELREVEIRIGIY